VAVIVITLILGITSTGNTEAGTTAGNAFDALMGTNLCEGEVPDGTLDAGEECDDPDFGGADCSSQGFVSGVLGCDSNCRFNTSSCELCSPVNLCEGCFPDGDLDSGEECDTPDLDGEDCSSQGFGSGVLSCDSDCKFDTSSCVPPPPVYQFEMSCTAETGESVDYDFSISPTINGTSSIIGNAEAITCTVDGGDAVTEGSGSISWTGHVGGDCDSIVFDAEVPLSIIASYGAYSGYIDYIDVGPTPTRNDFSSSAITINEGEISGLWSGTWSVGTGSANDCIIYAIQLYGGYGGY